jgi:putative membrane protein
MLQATLKKNDKKAKLFIFTVSFVVFIAVALLSKFKLNVDPGFDVHVFAMINAIINSCVMLLLGAGLVTALKKMYVWHKRIMLTAICLSILFLVSYIAHHVLAGETKFGDIDHDGILSDDEKLRAGTMRMVYYFILLTHIPLAAIMLPFILFTAYRALTGEYAAHKKLVRFTWPLWFYVAFTGIMVYLMISPYYH